MPMVNAAAHTSKTVGKLRAVFMMNLSCRGRYSFESTIRCRGTKTIGQNV